MIPNMKPAQTPAHVAFESSVDVITSRDQSESTFIALREPLMGTFRGGRSFWKGRKTLCAMTEQPVLHPEVELPQNKAGTRRYHACAVLWAATHARLVRPPFSSSQAPSPAAGCDGEPWDDISTSLSSLSKKHLGKEPKKSRQHVNFLTLTNWGEINPPPSGPSKYYLCLYHTFDGRALIYSIKIYSPFIDRIIESFGLERRP